MAVTETPDLTETPDPVPAAVRLTELGAGERGRLHTTDLAGHDREMLQALGLAPHCHFRLCKAGNPWIVQVRSTRVGLSDAVARRILVIPEREAGPV